MIQKKVPEKCTYYWWCFKNKGIKYSHAQT